jgi:hypothetical protein
MRSSIRQTSSDAKHAGLCGLDGAGFRMRKRSWPITLDKATCKHAHTQSDQKTKRGPRIELARRNTYKGNTRQDKSDRETQQGIAELLHSSAPGIGLARKCPSLNMPDTSSRRCHDRWNGMPRKASERVLEVSDW